MTTAPPLVDTHVHLFTTDLPVAAGAWTRPSTGLSAERYVAMLDAHGVAYGVVAAASLFGDHSDYTLEALRRYPRLRGTVIVDPGTDPGRLAELKAAGVVGVRLQWRRAATLPDLTAPEYRRFLRRVADLGWHVHLNIEGPRLPPVADALLASGVRLVFDHFGGPDPERGVDGPGFRAVRAALAGGRAWVKLSAGYRLRVPPETLAAYAGALLDSGGPERVFWGSDAPFVGAEGTVTFQDTIDAFALWVPDPTTRHRMSLAARAFYFDPA
ncbi:amidohydrolase family protein [Phytohabitans suffuscus]|uniref:Membrane protein n=1 Tax=Phytohabitans suffuscus TaxID=624315 RepID=A0A6F8YYH3_9ACTN|nr:amidohydrolase family protein [Phytohabitans suffuscus]BCB91116.1 membrane protein [Phytohabitans suffuscus]